MPSPGGGVPGLGGWCAWSGGGVCVPGSGGVCAWSEGVCLPGGGGYPGMH